VEPCGRDGRGTGINGGSLFLRIFFIIFFMSFAFYVWIENAFDGLHSVIHLQKETTVWLRPGFDQSSVASFNALRGFISSKK
jgi:hypothetical protein